MAENTDRAVVDASFVLSFLLPDEKVNLIDEVFDKFYSGEINLVAPILLSFEVFNGLHTAFLRKRIDQKTVQNLGEKFLSLDIDLYEADYLEISRLSLEENLSFYDASYLYLARYLGTPLMTLDNKLKDLG